MENGNNRHAANAIDDDPETLWHTQFSDNRGGNLFYDQDCEIGMNPAP